MAINKTVLAGAVFLATIWISSGAEAALVADRSGKTVYDTVKQKTWLANANLAATQKFGVSGINPDGSMSWDTAQRWIAAMNAANYLGSKHWSLPDTTLPDNGCSQKPKSAAFGYDCTGSQMGDLFYNGLRAAHSCTVFVRPRPFAGTPQGRAANGQPRSLDSGGPFGDRAAFVEVEQVRPRRDIGAIRRDLSA